MRLKNIFYILLSFILMIITILIYQNYQINNNNIDKSDLKKPFEDFKILLNHMADKNEDLNQKLKHLNYNQIHQIHDDTTKQNTKNDHNNLKNNINNNKYENINKNKNEKKPDIQQFELNISEEERKKRLLEYLPLNLPVISEKDQPYVIPNLKLANSSLLKSKFYIYPRNENNCNNLQKISHKHCNNKENTLKVSERDVRPILIVAVQRSGTHYIWEMLNRLGIKVHHEGIGPGGAVSWFYAYKTKFYAINNPLPLTIHQFRLILHEVRHPLRVVSTILNRAKKWDRFWDFIHKQEPSIDRTQSALIRAGKLWIKWNEHMEKYSDIRFQVEHTSPRDVCRISGFPESMCGNLNTKQAVIEPQPPSSNEVRLDLAASWEDFENADPELAKEMKKMCLRYGYYLDPQKHPQSLSTSEYKA